MIKRLLFLTIVSVSVLLFQFCEKKSALHSVSANKPPRQLTPVDSFSCAFYNVENLFDFTHTGTEYPEFIPGNSNWTKNIFIKKLSNISEVVHALDADIIGLCEIENENVLSLLNEKLQIPYAYSAFAFSGNSTGTALLSRFPIFSFKTISFETSAPKASRPTLEAHVQINSDTLTVFVNHWPSKNNPESDRISAAKALSDRITQLGSEKEYLILGDLNDNYNEFETIEKQNYNDTESATAIALLVSKGKTAHISTPIQELNIINNCAAHYDLWLELPVQNRWSQKFKNRPQTPDHIALPHSLYDPRGISYKDNSFEVFTWNGRLLNNGAPYRWQYNYIQKKRIHIGEGFSDHLPLKAHFMIGAFRADTVRQIVAQVASSENRVVKQKRQLTKRRTPKKVHSTIPGIWNAKDIIAVTPLTPEFFQIKGSSIAKNSSVASVQIPRPPSNPSKLSFPFKGVGTISFRLRYDNQPWIYFNAPGFSPSKSARYRSVQSVAADTITLHAHDCPDTIRTAELELRVAKEDSFNIEIGIPQWSAAK